MNSDIQIAVLQYDIEWQNVSVNLKKLDKILEGIKNPVDMIFLPEMFATGFTMQPELLSNGEIEEIRNWMVRIANKFQAACLGSMPERINETYYNRLYCFAPGNMNDFYDKKHLYTMGDEAKHYKPGKELKIMIYKRWKLLPLICYDLRFPVWSRNSGYKYDLLVYVANWPAVRNEVWETLLKARAMENQCYTIGVNRIGKDGRGIDYLGNSQVISPKGEVLNKLENQEGVLFSNLSYDLLQRFRTNFPVLDDADDFSIK